MRKQLVRLDNRPYSPYAPAMSAGSGAFGQLKPAAFFVKSPGREAARPKQARVRESVRILIADKELYTRRVLRVVLSNPRVALMEVDDGEAAVDLLAMKSFDLMFLGLELASMGAEETLHWIRRSSASYADIPVLAIAEPNRKDQLGSLWSAGLTDTVSRPINRADVAAKVLALLPGLSDSGL